MVVAEFLRLVSTRFATACIWEPTSLLYSYLSLQCEFFANFDPVFKLVTELQRLFSR